MLLIYYNQSLKNSCYSDNENFLSVFIMLNTSYRSEYPNKYICKPHQNGQDQIKFSITTNLSKIHVINQLQLTSQKLMLFR